MFYLPDEISATVSIIRIMYGGKDIAAELLEMTFGSEAELQEW